MIGGNSKITQDVLPYFITDGVPGRVKGLNSVGLKRGGFKASDLALMKKAFHCLFQHVKPLRETTEDLAAQDNPFATRLAEFIGKSKRGYHRAEM